MAIGWRLSPAYDLMPAPVAVQESARRTPGKRFKRGTAVGIRMGWIILRRISPRETLCHLN
jgi:hypothetical protein